MFSAFATDEPPNLRTFIMTKGNCSLFVRFGADDLADLLVNWFDLDRVLGKVTHFVDRGWYLAKSPDNPTDRVEFHGMSGFQKDPSASRIVLEIIPKCLIADCAVRVK